MRRRKGAALLLAVVLCVIGVLSGCSSGGDALNPDGVKLSPDHPVNVTVWHYYNGKQLAAFNTLVEEFNNTEGKELGIFVEGFSQGNVTDLETNVLDAANRKVGAGEIPSIVAAYADTAYAVDKLGLLVDLSPYFSDKELDAFVDSYIDEGRFSDGDELKIFPVAKSTEIFVLNKTDWDKFSEATGAQLSELNTIEGVALVAEKYYDWTDSLSPEPNDGRAFFGRDAMANYMLIGAEQLGTELFTTESGKVELNFSRDVVKKLWDNYYIPFIKGYFDASARFRSDDIRTGKIIAQVGSCSGATFFPTEVIIGDTQRYAIEMEVLECPRFDGGGSIAVQQGAGMAVTASGAEEAYASVQFLKWFTKPEQNIRFSLSSGYLPVTKESNDMEAIRAAITESEQDTATGPIIETAISTVNGNELYTPRAFENGTDARNILEYSMSDLAQKDRTTVKENLSKGMTLTEATAEFASDDYFDVWYESVKGQLEELMQ